MSALASASAVTESEPKPGEAALLMVREVFCPFKVRPFAIATVVLHVQLPLAGRSTVSPSLAELMALCTSEALQDPALIVAARDGAASPQTLMIRASCFIDGDLHQRVAANAIDSSRERFFPRP
jgi:hypothetical protein